MVNINPSYVRRKDAAKQLGVSDRTITNWMQKRIIPYRKIGRTVLFDPDELRKAVDRYKVNAIGEELES